MHPHKQGPPIRLRRQRRTRKGRADRRDKRRSGRHHGASRTIDLHAHCTQAPLHVFARDSMPGHVCQELPPGRAIAVLRSATAPSFCHATTMPQGPPTKTNGCARFSLRLQAPPLTRGHVASLPAQCTGLTRLCNLLAPMECQLRLLLRLQSSPYDVFSMYSLHTKFRVILITGCKVMRSCASCVSCGRLVLCAIHDRFA